MYNSYRVISRTRDLCLKALKVGGYVAIKQRFTDADVPSKTQYCPKCYRPGYSQVQDPSCTICYGTNYTSGYHVTIVKHGFVSDVQELTQYKKEGEIEVVKPRLYTEPEPILTTNDLIVVVDYQNDRIVQEGARYVAVDATPQRLRVYPEGLLNMTNGINETVIQSVDVAKEPDNSYLYNVPL